MCVLETYDKGYVFTGSERYEHNFGFWKSFIIKTDINGNLLWKKYIGENKFSTFINCLDETADGGLVLCGDFSDVDTVSYPFITKLNSCGEYEWSTIYKVVNAYSGYAIKIIEINRNNFIVAFVNVPEGSPGNIWSTIFKIDSVGDTIWHQTDNYVLHSLSVVKDSSILAAGYTFTSDPGEPEYVYIRSSLLKVSKLGKQNFFTIFGESEKLYTYANSAIENSDGSHLTVGGSFSIRKDMESVLYVIKYDSNGKIQWNKQCYDSSQIITNPQIFYYDGNDYIILSSQTEDHSPYYSTIKVMRMDTCGNIKKEKNYSEGLSIEYVSGIKTSDGKYLLSCMIKRTTSLQEIYAMKINHDLEIDSLFSNNYKYDTLCSHGIDSSTITLDSARVIYLDIKVPPVSVFKPVQEVDDFSVFPNPAEEYFMIRQKNSAPLTFSYILFDMTGKIVMSAERVRSAEEKVDIENLKQGIYFLKINTDKAGLYFKILKK